MSEKKPEKPTQLSFADLLEAKPAWETVVQPLDGGHVKLTVRKRPPAKK